MRNTIVIVLAAILMLCSIAALTYSSLVVYPRLDATQRRNKGRYNSIKDVLWSHWKVCRVELVYMAIVVASAGGAYLLVRYTFM